MYSNILDKADLLDLLPLCVSESLTDLVSNVSSRSHVYADPASMIPFLRIPSTKTQSAEKAAMVVGQVVVGMYYETCAANAARSDRIASFPDGFEQG